MITYPRLITDLMVTPMTAPLTNVISSPYLTYDINDLLGETVVELLDFGTNKEAEKSEMALSCDRGMPT